MYTRLDDPLAALVDTVLGRLHNAGLPDLWLNQDTDLGAQRPEGKCLQLLFII